MNIPTSQLVLSVAIMAVVTYLTRSLPLTLFRREIKNPYIRAFLEYIPYAVLGAMTLPDIFFSTSSIWSALAGLTVAMILSYREKSLLTVAVAACAVVFVAERFL
ncbi:MAG: AzlD domain-containing protein [Clostridia bacterium]|nr:AzlD domain-containing protein [Clostridia bacterium]